MVPYFIRNVKWWRSDDSVTIYGRFSQACNSSWRWYIQLQTIATQHYVNKKASGSDSRNAARWEVTAKLNMYQMWKQKDRTCNKFSNACVTVKYVRRSRLITDIVRNRIRLETILFRSRDIIKYVGLICHSRSNSDQLEKIQKYWISKKRYCLFL